MSSINVSLNKILYGAGDYRTARWLAAYCLPNYGDIRAELGSKQVIYRNSDSRRFYNQELWDRFNTKTQAAFRLDYDPEDKIYDDLWDLQVLLHETVGHGSGQFYKRVLTKEEVLALRGGEKERADKERADKGRAEKGRPDRVRARSKSLNRYSTSLSRSTSHPWRR